MNINSLSSPIKRRKLADSKGKGFLRMLYIIIIVKLILKGIVKYNKQSSIAYLKMKIISTGNIINKTK